ncbi:MAG: hypothetical protein HQL15_09735 [Candidatus Omnitrophica bacterium]|nr:hypothetical protein [Candidatus Omnitrophota bacterium]
MVLNVFKRVLIVAIFSFVYVSSAYAATKQKGVEEKVDSVVGSLLDRETLGQGGDIALVPFKAGAKAEANDELDRLSLMIIRGIKESLDAQKNAFHVVDPEKTQPRMALQGYIDEFSKTGKLRKMMFRPAESCIALEGEVWLISNGQRLLSFSEERRFNPKKEKTLSVAYDMGRSIGDYLGSHAK